MMPNESTERDEQPHGRYYAEHVRVTGSNPESLLQQVLDAKEGEVRHLARMAGEM